MNYCLMKQQEEKYSVFRKLSRLTTVLLFMSLPPLSAYGQQEMVPEKDSESITFFVPHWYVKAQVGPSYDVGEGNFGQLISPGVQLSGGYQFNELLSARASINGLWARNRYAYPQEKYRWNFLQGTIDGEINLTRLFLGSKPDRDHNVYVFAGIGTNYTFNNDDAEEAARNYDALMSTRYGALYDRSRDGIFQKLWQTNRWNFVFRTGIGYDYYITDNFAIGGEFVANMLPDHFNSKKGRNDNKDWHFNFLLGVKFALGKRHGRIPRHRAVPAPVPTPVEKSVEKVDSFTDVPIEKISFNVNIQFLINQSIIRGNQISKLQRLLDYLNKHPRAFIRLSGYADKETGTPVINLRLSRERAQVVSKYLQDAGIQEWRIRRFAKGDTVQPFDIPEDNRVCICFVYDPDNPVPMENW